jgi:hypothetical protein
MRVGFIALSVSTIFACSLLTEVGSVRAANSTCVSDCKAYITCDDFCARGCSGDCSVQFKTAQNKCLSDCAAKNRRRQ